LELETQQRVWDYVGDNYVHRLIQNKADGKLVELPGPERDEFEAFTLAHKEIPKLWQDKLNEVEQKLKSELASRDKQILERNEQVRDLMFFL